MNSESSEPVLQIKGKAAELGFDACGIAAAAPVDCQTRLRFQEWLQQGRQAGMDYMSHYFEQRCNPQLLVEGARSVIVMALNYYPAVRQAQTHPQFAYYAYGKDYHNVIKDRLHKLISCIKEIDSNSVSRAFTDTAPLAEKYWAEQAGIGFTGRNTQLIIPRRGSYFFLGSIVTTLRLPVDQPQKSRCGTCRSCLDHCPAKALIAPGQLNANRCLSYQTIENRNELSPEAVTCIGNRVYGCDICQQVCPWNRFSSPCQTPEFAPTPEFLSLDYNKLSQLSQKEFRSIFRHSAVKRAKYQGLMRNIKAIKK